MGKKSKKRSKKAGKKKPNKVLQTKNNPDAPKPDNSLDIQKQESDPKLREDDEKLIADLSESKGVANIVENAKVETKANTNANSEPNVQTTDDSEPVPVSSDNEQDDKAIVEKPTANSSGNTELMQQTKTDDVQPCAESLDDKKDNTNSPAKSEVETSSKLDSENKSNEENEAIEVVKPQSEVKVKDETSQSDDLAETTKRNSPTEMESEQDVGKIQPAVSTQARSLTEPSQQEEFQKADAPDCFCVIL